MRYVPFADKTPDQPSRKSVNEPEVSPEALRHTQRQERRAQVAIGLVPVVASIMGVGVGQLSLRTRGRASTAFARQVAMYLTHVTCGLNLTEVGKLFGRDRTTVGHACEVVELKRDEPGFDETMQLLERIAEARLVAAGLREMPWPDGSSGLRMTSSADSYQANFSEVSASVDAHMQAGA